MQLTKIFANKYFLFATCIVIYWVVVFGLGIPILYNDNRFFSPDCQSYIDAAKQLYLQHQLHDIRPIGIAALYGLPLLFQQHFCGFTEWAWGINFILWFYTLLVFYNTCILFVSHKITSATTFLLACQVSAIIFSTQVISEIPFIFCVALGLYYIAKYFKSHQNKYLNYFTFVLCLSVLIRPSTYYFFLIWLLVYFIYCSFKKQFVAIACALFCSIVLYAYQAQMKKQYGQFTISLISDRALLYYLSVKTNQLLHNSSYNHEVEKVNQLLSITPKEEIACLGKKTILQQLHTHPITVCKAAISNAIDNSLKGNACLQKNSSDASKPWIGLPHQILHAISVLQNIICSCVALFGMFFIYKYRKKYQIDRSIKMMKILFLFCMYIISISAISFYQHDRFHIVIAPIIYFIIAYQYALFIKQAKPPAHLKP
jgi:hypothetical protein